jgi:hypothetical protein
MRGGEVSAELLSSPRGAIHRFYDKGPVMDEELFGSGVFISQLCDADVDAEAIGRWTSRRRRRQQVCVATWHLVHSERALTWCGLDIGYGNPRRRWIETPEDQRCQRCIGRLRRVNQTNANQRNQRSSAA